MELMVKAKKPHILGIEILKIKRKLKLQIQSEKKISREFNDFKRDRDADKDTSRL